jgi:hypothetical protein
MATPSLRSAPAEPRVATIALMASVGCASTILLLAFTGPAQARSGPTSLVSCPPAKVSLKAGCDLSRVACASLTQCTALDISGHAITFNPKAPRKAAPVRVITGIDTFGDGIACPSVSQCTAVGSVIIGPHGYAREATFNPAAPGQPNTVIMGGPKRVAVPCSTLPAAAALPGATQCAIEPSGVFRDVSCPSVRQCTSPDGGGEVTFDPVTAVVTTDSRFLGLQEDFEGIACPSLSECVSFDTGRLGSETDAGGAIAFNPIAPTPTPRVRLTSHERPGGMSCPSVSQCTAVERGKGTEVTFNPSTSTVSGRTTFFGGGEATGIACPSPTQCTAVAGTGGGQYEVTFNPQGPGKGPRVLLDSDPHNPALTNVACPSASQCTAVNTRGAEITFNPKSPPRIAAKRRSAKR